MTTWHRLISDEMIKHGEGWGDVESMTLTQPELVVPINEFIEFGKPFTLWTDKRVYFPWCYDGTEGVASVSRNPDGIPTKHIGG
jgi:hypothetical protein